MRHHAPRVDHSVPIFATVSARDTGEFDTTVSHLTSTTAFIETMHSAAFGDPLELHILGLSIAAEIVFISDAPMGWVLRFPENARLLELAQQTRPPEDALPAELPEEALILEDPIEDLPMFWGEPTPTFPGPPPRFKAS